MSSNQTKHVRISESSIETLQAIQETTPGEPSFRSLADAAIEQLAEEINKGD
ncbi:hypothetical protein [Halobaculum gomorrense]|uniref:hypothetical protein n=1 Tax=Halobaculum gomorrense TaxID=43928 RepID=UPI0013564948|nr:hypothetical protein [Halobaculum gomorrense]